MVTRGATSGVIEPEVVGDPGSDEFVAHADQASRLRSLMGRSHGADDPRPRPEQRAMPSGVRPRVGRAPATRLAPVIAIASGKGGVGKTNLAVNLAICMERAGQGVLLVDADLGQPNADVLLGLPTGVRPSLPGAGGPPRAVLERSTLEFGGVAPRARLLVATPSDREPGAARSDLILRAVQAIRTLREAVDLVVVDAAAGVGIDVLTLLPGATLSLIVVTPEPTSITDAYALIKCLSRGPGGGDGRSQLALVVNQASCRAEAERVAQRLRATTRRFLSLDVPLAAWIPTDPRVPEAVRARRPLCAAWPGAPSARAVARLASSLRGVLTPSGPAFSDA